MGYELDETDKKILRILQEDARLSFRKIAEQVDVSVVTVINRVEKMQDAGLIRGYTVDLDYNQLGYHLIAAIELVVKGKQLKKLEEELFEHPNVLAVYEITGDTDILLITKFKDRNGLGEFVVGELVERDDVEKTITHMAFDTHMERHHLEI